MECRRIEIGPVRPNERMNSGIDSDLSEEVKRLAGADA